MRYKRAISWFFISIFFFPLSYLAIAQEKENSFSLRNLFGTSPQQEEVHIDKYFHFSELHEWGEETERFYRNRDYKPAWFNNSSLNKLGEKVMENLKSSWEEGLPEPVVYLAKVEDAMLRMHKRSAGRTSLPEIITEADVNLTLAWFDFASKLHSGILNPAELNVVWEILPDEVDLVKHLEEAVNKGKISQSFDRLKPQHEQYDLLLTAYKNLLEVKASGGWLLPDTLTKLKEKDSHHSVIRLKRFLSATGDIQEVDTFWFNSPGFDHILTQGVRKFQFRHGLKQDGVVGEATLKQMSVPIDYRLDQIRLNIDRIRWLPDDFGNHHIVINIPDFSFEYRKNGESVQEMNAVVGRNENYTPVLEDTLYSIVFNPTWNIPNSIATNEIFPKMLEDTTYMERNNYSILYDSYVSKDTIDYKTYDWSEVSRDSFPFFIVQHPGPLNSLGRVQFMLQNQYSIFLHDTPANHLFSIQQRDFSHGCVRLERPAELAVTILREQLPTDTISRYLSEQEKKVIYLEKKIPVHIIYQTAWVDENDLLHFRKDIYGFDRLSMPVLKRRIFDMTVMKENEY